MTALEVIARIEEKISWKELRAFEHLDTEPIPGTYKNRFIMSETPEEMVRLSDLHEIRDDLREEISA